MLTDPVITSAQHPLIKHLLKLRTCKKYRTSCGEVFIEGEKVLSDLSYAFCFESLIVTESTVIPASIQYKKLVVISKQNFCKISGVNTPSFLASTLKLPQATLFGPKDTLLVLDGLQDPGNIGSLVRSARAFGIDGLFLAGETVDYFNDKIIRASRGALFALPFCSGSQQDLLNLAVKHEAQIWVADKQGKPYQHLAKNKKGPIYLVLGSEGQGASDALKRGGTPITIPMKQGTESLNVAAAGAILLHHIGQGGANEV